MLVKSFFAGTIFDVSKRQNAFFWAGQIAVIISTILGVFLAASAGLKTAIDFHEITSDEQNYHSLSALREELNANNELILSFIEKKFVFDTDNKVSALRGGELQPLDKFVWTTMLRTTETLELPVDILKKTSEYYSKYEKTSRNYNEYTGYDRIYAANQLIDLSKKLKEELIPRMDEKLRFYRDRLQAYRVIDK